MPTELSVHDLAEALSQRDPIVLIDVRLPWEYQLAALPDSILLPLNELSRRLDEIPTPEHARIVVYCHHGVRSLTGAAILERAGYPNVFSLAGGIDAWSLEVDASTPRY